MDSCPIPVQIQLFGACPDTSPKNAIFIFSVNNNSLPHYGASREQIVASPRPHFLRAKAGIKGPCGDQYLYSHFQVDAQGSFRIRRGLTFLVSGLNLNNAVFGFYNGSPQFPIQCDYYKPTFTFGFRWEPLAGKE